MPITRLNHAVLYVRDVERSEAFYTDVLGFRVLNVMPAASGRLPPGPRLDQRPRPRPLRDRRPAPAPRRPAGATVGLYHLAWEVDTLAELERLSQRLAERRRPRRRQRPRHDEEPLRPGSGRDRVRDRLDRPRRPARRRGRRGPQADRPARPRRRAGPLRRRDQGRRRHLPPGVPARERRRTMPSTTDSPVLQTVPLGAQWPTIDPFLFCAHHDDDYPAGDDAWRPRCRSTTASSAWTSPATDGWSMYHGRTRAGLPAAPAPRLRDGHLRAHRASSTTPTRSAPPPASGGATCSGSPPARASCTPRCSRCSTRPAQPARAVPDLAEPAGRRQDGRPVLHDAVGRRHPVVRRSTTTVAPPRSP